MFVAGRYEQVQLDKPAEADHIVLDPASADRKPAIVFWDIANDKLDAFTLALREFLKRYRSSALMISGPMERTWPGIEHLGAELLRRTLLVDEHILSNDIDGGVGPDGNSRRRRWTRQRLDEQAHNNFL